MGLNYRPGRAQGAWNWFLHGCGGNWAGVHSFIHKKEKKKSNQLFLEHHVQSPGRQESKGVLVIAMKTNWVSEGLSDPADPCFPTPCSIPAPPCSSLNTPTVSSSEPPHPSKICLWADRCSRVTKPRHPDSRPDAQRPLTTLPPSYSSAWPLTPLPTHASQADPPLIPWEGRASKHQRLQPQRLSDRETRKLGPRVGECLA